MWQTSSHSPPAPSGWNLYAPSFIFFFYFFFFFIVHREEERVCAPWVFIIARAARRGARRVARPRNDERERE